MVVNNSYNGQLMVVNIIDNGYNFITMVNYSFMVVHRIFGNGRSIDIFPFQRYAATLPPRVSWGC